MATQPDEFDALRTVVATLEPLDQTQKARILRWAHERLGITAGDQSPAAPSPTVPPAQLPTRVTDTPAASEPALTDIKAFVSSKNPQSDQQFAATVAYYYKFEAPPSERKEEIGPEELLEACRRTKRRRPTRARQTLLNAHNYGLLDKGLEKGFYCLNSVGENLVAMALPDTPVPGASTARGAQARRPQNTGSRAPGKNHKQATKRRKKKKT